jgi:hypothetical protein
MASFVDMKLTSTPSTIPFNKHVSRRLCLNLLDSQGMSPGFDAALSVNPGHVMEASPPATRDLEREGKEARKAEDWRNP